MEKLVCALCGMMAALAVSAKTTTWQGASGANWNVAANWSDGIPTDGDTVVLTGTDSNNDLVGLTLASLQLSGSTAITLSGNALTVSAGTDSVTCGGAAHCVAVPLVLSSGDNTVTVGSGADVIFSGVISGEGRLVLRGANTSTQPSAVIFSRDGKLAWPSIVRLSGANTYSGGTQAEKVTLFLQNAKACGSSRAVSFDGNGDVVFAADTSFAYDFADFGNTTRFLATVDATLNGDIESATFNGTLVFLLRAAKSLTVSGSVNVPLAAVEPQGRATGTAQNNCRLEFRKPLVCRQLQGNAGATGLPMIVNLWAAQNQIGTLYQSGYVRFHCRVADAFAPGMVISGKGNEQGGLELNGYSQAVGSFAAGTASETRNVTSSSGSPVLTVNGAVDSTVQDTLNGSLSLVCDPGAGHTVSFAAARSHAMSGGLTVRSGTLCVTHADARFPNVASLTVAKDAGADFASAGAPVFSNDDLPLDLASDSSLTLPASANWRFGIATLDGVPLRPGKRSHADLPVLADNGATIDVAYGGGAFAYASDETIKDLRIFASGTITVADGVTLTLDGAPVAATGCRLSVVTAGTGRVVCEALKGQDAEGLLVNGQTAAFDGGTGALAAKTYAGTSIPARGGVIANDATATVVIDSDGDSAAGPVRLASSPAAVSTLVQATAADAEVDLGSSTLTAGSLVRTAGSGNLSFASGTLAAATDGLTVENRDTDGEIAVTGSFSPGSAGVTKIGDGAFALSTSGSWTTPFNLLFGTVAFTGSDETRLTVGKPDAVAQATFSARSESGLLTLTQGSTAIGALAVSGSTPTGKTVSLVERTGETCISDKAVIAANDFDIRAAVGKTAKLTVDGGAYVRFGVANGALRLGGVATGAKLSELVVGAATIDVSGYKYGNMPEVDRSIIVGDTSGDGRVVLNDGACVTNRVRLGDAEHVGALVVKDGACLRTCGGNAKDYSNPRYSALGYSSSATVRGLGYAEVQKGGALVFSGATTMSLLGAGLADAVLAVCGGCVNTLESEASPFFFAPGAGDSTLYVSGGAFTNRLNYASKDTSSNARGCPMDSGTGSGVITVTDGGTCVFANADGVRFRQNASKASLGGTVLNANGGGLLSWTKDSTTAANLTACLDDNGNAIYCPVFLNFNGGVFRPFLSGKQTPFSTFSLSGYGLRHVVSRITVFEDGGTIGGSSAGESYVMLTQEIDAPTGKGVASVPWTSRTGLIGAPSVVIEGDGYGASACALFDSASGTVTNVVVTSPGCDYTAATAVVRYASTELARIPCALADNVAGALTLTSPRTYATAPKAWTVPEVVLRNYLCLQKDNILTNTLVTLKAGASISGYDDWYTGNNNTLRLRAIRGTGGTVVVGKKGDAKTDGIVHVRELSLDGATGVNFNGMTLSVEGTWQLDANELVDRAEKGEATGKYPCTVAFGPNCEIDIRNPELLRKEDKKYVLFSRASGYGVTGAPKLADSTVLPEGWKLRTSATKVTLVYSEGLVLIVR